MRKAYLLVQLNIHNQTAYLDYAQKAIPIIGNYGGQPLVVDDAPLAIEGATKQRVILLEFPSEEAINSCYNSPEYQLIMQERKDSTTSDIILLHAFQAE